MFLKRMKSYSKFLYRRSLAVKRRFVYPKLNKRSPFGQRLLLKVARENLRPIFKGVLMVVWV